MRKLQPPNSHPRAGCIPNRFCMISFCTSSQLAPSRGMYQNPPPACQPNEAPNSHPRAGCIFDMMQEEAEKQSPNSHPRAGCIRDDAAGI